MEKPVDDGVPERTSSTGHEESLICKHIEWRRMAHLAQSDID